MELLSRKFIMGILILIAGLVIVLTGNAEYQQFLDLARWIMGLYVIGNVATKFSGIANL